MAWPQDRPNILSARCSKIVRNASPAGIEDMQSFVIDSNILIYHLKDDVGVTKSLNEWLMGGSKLCISAITRIELLAAPVMREGEEEKILRLLDKFVMIPVDARIADTSARIRRKYHLELGDSIIAATAMLMDSTLVTRNIRDFRKIIELQLLKL